MKYPEFILQPLRGREQKGSSDESAHLPYMWVEVIVGSRPRSLGFFPDESPPFSSLHKNNTSTFQFVRAMGNPTNFFFPPKII